MSPLFSRREWLIKSGISAAAANLVLHLPSLSWGRSAFTPAKQRLVVVFSPNGVIPDHFWPEVQNDELQLKRILEPLAPYRGRMITMQGLGNRIKGDGDGHMRGIGCLLTGIELFPGDIQGGSDTPAGWSMGISVDQYLKNQFQANPETQTRFGSLEFGLMVPKRADTWTRMSYTGPNQPVTPIDNPYRMFEKLYGQTKNRELLASVLDELSEDFVKVERMIGQEDRRLLQDHLEMVRQVERDLQMETSRRANEAELNHAVPYLQPNVREDNDNMPVISQMQIELMVNALAADFTRIATYQITNSVGQPRMKWLGIEEGHHELSHEPDDNADAYEKLININTWYAEQVSHLARRLDETPEPGGEGSMLDHTTILWTNELGKGNSHTREDIPFVFVGGGLGWKTGVAHRFGGTPHNRVLMSLCAAMGHPVESFGNSDFCNEGVLTGLTG